MDEEGFIGERRVLRSRKVITRVNLAVLLFTGNFMGSYERSLIACFETEELPYILIHNKTDIVPLDPEIAAELTAFKKVDILDFCCKDPWNRETLLALIRKNLTPLRNRRQSLFQGLDIAGNQVVLVCPVDDEVPEGRLIPSNVQVMREILDNNAIAVIVKDAEELARYFDSRPVKPKIVVTDSRLFEKVDNVLPPDVPLTEFDILLARSKGDFEAYLQGTPAIDTLKDGDRILLLESCPHHSNCEDFGRVKIPRMLRTYTGKDLFFDVATGTDDLHRPLSDYSLVIHCDACMISRSQLISRLRPVKTDKIPLTNYGMAVAYVRGVYARAIEALKFVPF